MSENQISTPQQNKMPDWLAMVLLFMFCFTNRVMAGDDLCKKVEAVAMIMFDENGDCNYSIGKMGTCTDKTYLYGKLNNGNRFTIIYDETHKPFGVLLSNGKVIKMYGYIYSNDYKEYFYSKEKPKDYNFLLEFKNCTIKKLILKSE